MVDLTPLPPVVNLPYVENLYRRFLRDPRSVGDEWRSYFASIEQESHLEASEDLVLQDRLDQLVRAYRNRGHLAARIDPLNGATHHLPAELDPLTYGIKPEDYHRRASARSIDGVDLGTVGDVIAHMQATYSDRVGVQISHIDNPEIYDWLCRRMESCANRTTLSVDEQRRVLTKLTDATLFERFIHRTYPGAKRFSLEGAEGLIPLLDVILRRSQNDGVSEVVLGMAHRGRLNVLHNVLGKSARRIFREFEDPYHRRFEGAGDVKYHLGFSADPAEYAGLHLSLSFNPSHLGFVTPVVTGRARAKQDRKKDWERRHTMALLVHGDAAFPGQGVVAETLNMGNLAAYHIGGTIHVIVNNQIGFTTPPQEARSATYPTDVAKMLQGPIFHVNAEEPEAVVHVAQLCADYRARFHRDAFIDLVGYRRYGHNEGDEPAFTQPLMYKKIRTLPAVTDRYVEHLLSLGDLTREEASQMMEERRERLEKELSLAREAGLDADDWLQGVWSGFRGGSVSSADHPSTQVPRGRLQKILTQTSTVPDDFHPHPKLRRFMERGIEQARGARPIDWATAERLALGSLLMEGVAVRLTGQDTPRGTFSQRHGILVDVEDGSHYVPLQHVAPDQARFELANSPLNEAATLGFEYGYSLDRPEALVMWEAQFGDFVNAGQVIVDQFIVSAEDKWRRLSGIVLLLPHGFEGQGPEHSSARLERLLCLCAEDNIQVINCTTPAQYFHALRRQALRRWRKPLMMLTPKSLLRLPEATSSLAELAEGHFAPYLPDPTVLPEQASRVLLCSGKVYYDLRETAEEHALSDVYIGRIEELYPLPRQALTELEARITAGVPLVWVQEEPANMGAWQYLITTMRDSPFEQRLTGVMREASASPATGSHATHHREQQRLLLHALGLSNEAHSSAAEPHGVSPSQGAAGGDA